MTRLRSPVALLYWTRYTWVFTWGVLMLRKFLCLVWVLSFLWTIRILERTFLVDHPLHALLNLALSLRLKWGLFFLLCRQWFKRDLLILYFNFIMLFNFTRLLNTSKFYWNFLWTRFIINSLVRHRSLRTHCWSLWTCETLAISICLPLSWLTCSLWLNWSLDSIAFSESIDVISDKV